MTSFAPTNYCARHKLSYIIRCHPCWEDQKEATIRRRTLLEAAEWFASRATVWAHPEIELQRMADENRPPDDPRRRIGVTAK